MPIEDFMISVFVGVDDTRKALFGSPKPGRTRGRPPDGRIARCGRWSGEGSFGDRTRWVRQATRLVWVKERLWRFLRTRVPSDSQVSILDSFPLNVCEPARAYRVRLFRDEAAWGFRWHRRIPWPGVIAEVLIAPANVSDLLLEGVRGRGMGDRRDGSPRTPKGLLSARLGSPGTPQRLDFLADPDRHPSTDQALSCPTDLGSGLPHLPESPPSHPGRLPQPSGGSRALAIEPLGDILKNAGGDRFVSDVS